MNPLYNLRNLGRLAGVSLFAALLVTGCGGEDGQDGAPPVLDKQEAGDECEHGGTVFTSGYDVDGDGEIDDVVSETVVCDGAPGEAGEDGEDGADGSDTLVSTSEEEAGDNCTHGGIKIETGVDEDGSGDLSEGEVDETRYVCNQQCGTAEPLDFQVNTDEFPTQWAEGYTYEASVDTDADQVAVELIDPTSGAIDLGVDYDSEEKMLSVEHTDGLGTVDVAMVVTDGCDITLQTLRLGPYEEALADIYVAHVFPGVGEVDVVDTEDDDSAVATLDTFDVAGPLTVDAGDYNFDIVDTDDDSVLGTSPTLTIEPFADRLIYAYSDGGDLEFGDEAVDTSAPDSGNFRARAIHVADTVGDIDVHAVADDDSSTVLFDDLAFGAVSDADYFDADADATAGLDTTDDGDVDVDYSASLGVFSDGANLDFFVIHDDDTNFGLAFDYTSNSASLYDPRMQTFFSAPGSNIPQASDGGEASDVITVDDCGTVDSITMDIDASHSFYTSNFTIYLSNPAGDEYALWSEGSTVNGDGDNIIGNFNDTIDPDSGWSGEEVDYINVFEGDAGTGDWTARIWNDSCCSDGTFNSWALNLVCTD